MRRAVAHTSTLQLQQLQAHLREREKEHLQQTRQSTAINIFANQKAATKPNISTTSTLTSTTTTTTATTTNNNTNNQISQNNSNLQINPLINQILELPNIFETLNMSRDSRYLLSRFVISII